MTVDERDDNSLLRAIGHRDHKAFGELCERYQKPAFAIAFRILHDTADAEDATQDALLSIWLSPGTSPVRDVRRWVFGIVVRKSLDVSRGRARNSKREGKLAMERSNYPVDGAATLEATELLTVLRAEFDQLPQLEREILMCAYCTSMSQQEIAELVGVSRRTVSNKIDTALNGLRLNLTRAGVALVVPLLSKDTLYEAMTTGQECPLGLSARIAQKATDTRAERTVSKRNLSRRAPLIRGGGWPLTAGILAALSLGLGLYGAWSLRQPALETQPAIVTPPAQAVKANPPAAENDKPVHARWSFEKGPAPDLQPIQLDWKWKATSANSGQMVAPREIGLLVSLPIRLPNHPVAIKIKANIVEAGTYSAGAVWAKPPLLVPGRVWNAHLAFQHSEWPPPSPLNLTIYVIDRYIFTQSSPKDLSSLLEARAPHPSREIVLTFARMNIEQIQLDSIAPEQIPESLRDIPRLIQQLHVESVDFDEHGNAVPTTHRP